MSGRIRKITGLEESKDVPQKVRLLYHAVAELIAEGADVNHLRVSTITEKAGIGKGTAYDYFDTKEDIIACAIVSRIRSISEEIRSTLLQRNSFSEQINLIMDAIEKEGRNHQWFIRFVHVMTDNNEISLMVRDKLIHGSQGRLLPASIFAEVIRDGKERGEIRKEIQDDYLIFSVFSRLLTYMISIYTQDCFRVYSGKIRPLVFQGIMEEFGVPKEDVKK